LLAVVVIGIAVYLLSQPKEGSVEWHKREYRSARMSLAAATRSVSNGAPVQPLTRSERQPLVNKLYAHEEALLAAGFLAKRELPLNGADATPVIMELASESAIEGYASGRLKVDVRGTNIVDTLVLTAPSNDLPKWEALIRKADGPERRN
jgi:hypothetical protein